MTLTTYLSHFRNQKLLAIGPYQCSLDLLKADVHRLWTIYEKQAKELTLPEFYKIWSDAQGHLLHYACPPTYGRVEFMNVLYALFLEYCSKPTHPLSSTSSSSFPTVFDRQHHFAMYSVYILFWTTPTFVEKVPMEISISFLEQLVTYVFQSPLFDLKYMINQLLDVIHIIAWDTFPTSTWCENRNGNWTRLLSPCPPSLTSPSLPTHLSLQLPLSAQTYLLERAGLPPSFENQFQPTPLSSNPLIESSMSNSSIPSSPKN